MHETILKPFVPSSLEKCHVCESKPSNRPQVS